MITCTYCGNANPDNRTGCQYCGAPLSNFGKRNENEPGFQPSVQPQQSVPPMQSAQATELPAWLQSLRSDAPTQSSEPVRYSAADFIDESDLPRWMQSNSGPGEEDVKPQTPSMRPSSVPGPNTDEGYVRNISAHDLIDEQMLPAWMKSESGVGSGENSSAGQRNISASGLIQQESVPDWMRNFPQEQPGAGETPGTPGIPGHVGQPAKSPSMPSQSSPSYPAFQPQASQGYGSQPLSAHDFIDQQALPPWLREQGVQGSQENQGFQGGLQGGQQPWSAAYQEQPADAPAKGFSASSLVDMNSLPSWMRNADMPASSQPAAQGYAANPTMPSSPSQGQAMWQNMPAQQQQPPSQQGGMSANSFIDMNALPEWLRAASEQGQPAGQGGQIGQGLQGGQGYAMPPRADNVRVPSRPRGEIGMNEGNEAAANAFASMLGVASHAPQFTQNPQGPQNSQNPSYSASPMSPMSSASTSAQPYQNNQNAMYAGSPPAHTASAAPQPSYMNSIGVAQVPPMNYPVNGQQMGGQMGGQPGIQPGQNAMQYNQVPGQPGQPFQPMQPVQQYPSSQLNQEKPQKRGGLFEAIRNFFFRQS